MSPMMMRYCVTCCCRWLFYACLAFMHPALLMDKTAVANATNDMETSTAKLVDELCVANEQQEQEQDPRIALLTRIAGFFVDI